MFVAPFRAVDGAVKRHCMTDSERTKVDCLNNTGSVHSNVILPRFNKPVSVHVRHTTMNIAHSFFTTVGWILIVLIFLFSVFLAYLFKNSKAYICTAIAAVFLGLMWKYNHPGFIFTEPGEWRGAVLAVAIAGLAAWFLVAKFVRHSHCCGCNGCGMECPEYRSMVESGEIVEGQHDH